ncbi:MAG: XdhC family protein [Bacillota bacterium]
MSEKEFFKKAKKILESDRSALLGIVTDVEGVKENNEIQKLFGVKFIVDENFDFIFAEKDVKADKSKLIENIFSKKIIETLKFNKIITKKIKRKDAEIEIYMEPLFNTPKLIIFGGGHVSLPLYKMGKLINFNVEVVDDRKEYVNEERFPEADKLICRDFSEYIKELNIKKNDYLVIVTRGHEYDYEVLKSVIKSNAAYIGMIGSDTKVNLIFEELMEKDNIDKKFINRVYAPIGLGIGSETPEEIAVSIISQIVKVRRLGHE